MQRPDLTFNSNVPPFAALSAVNYVTTALGAPAALPVLAGEASDNVIFRIFNNLALNSGVAAAVNVIISTFDGAGAGSQTASTLVISQLWIHLYESMFGESRAGSYYSFTSYTGADTCVGGLTSVYVPEFGTDGSTSPQIRAGTDGAGWGYLEMTSYATPPETGTPFASILFGIDVMYQWSS
jgi:hypothetical protein